MFKFGSDFSPVFGVYWTRSTAAVLGIPFSSKVTVFGWRSIMRNGPAVSDWSLLYSFFVMVSAVICTVLRNDG